MEIAYPKEPSKPKDAAEGPPLACCNSLASIGTTLGKPTPGPFPCASGGTRMAMEGPPRNPGKNCPSTETKS